MKKLQSQDLRIGNYIEYNGKLVSIMELLSDYCRLYINDKEWISANYDQIKAIELTEEWLLKLGFSFLSNPKRLYNGTWINGKFCIYKSLGENIYWRQIWCYDEEEEKDMVWKVQDEEVEILYLHQLQNYFYVVTGTELFLE